MIRQIKELMSSVERESNLPSRGLHFLVLGDRDYRTERDIHAAERTVAQKVKQIGHGVSAKLTIWRRNEFENYLLDRDAIERAIMAYVMAKGMVKQWDAMLPEFRKHFDEQVHAQKQKVIEAIANRIQDQEPKLAISTAMERARKELDNEWGDGLGLVDAKILLGDLRRWLQEKKINCHLSAREIIEHMREVHEDVALALKRLRKLAGIKSRGDAL